jgi:hypothetical protein
MDERRDLVDREELRRAVVKAFADHFPMAAYDRLNRAADAVLAVPAIADALARDAKVAEDIVWLAKLAQGSSWPGEMADRVQRAADRVVLEYGSKADRAAIAALYPSPGDRDDSEEQK